MPHRHINLSFAIYCAVSLVEVSGESSVRIVVQVNNVTVTRGDKLDEKVICNVDDIINFSCDGCSMKSGKYCAVVYQKVGIKFKIPKDGSYETNLLDYSVKVHNFDDKTKVHCELETWNKNNNEYTFSDTSIPVTLIVKSGDDVNETIPNVNYSERNPVTHICSESDNHLIVLKNGIQRNYKEKTINLLPSDTDSVIFCSKILADRERLNRPNGRILYKRIIQNHTKYTYISEPKETASLSQNATLTSTQIAIIVGVICLICITLVAVYILYKTKRPPVVTTLLDQDTNNYGSSTELIYAELALSQAPLSGCSTSQVDAASPYAEIDGVMARIPQDKEESPYAEIIFKRKIDTIMPAFSKPRQRNLYQLNLYIEADLDAMYTQLVK